MFTRLLTSGKFSELAPVLSGNDLALDPPAKTKPAFRSKKTMNHRLQCILIVIYAPQLQTRIDRRQVNDRHSSDSNAAAEVTARQKRLQPEA
jgi:hypothetical protein